ncbi:MAG: o-succinylbenzoate synthase [Cyanobacteriota bacterium]
MAWPSAAAWAEVVGSLLRLAWRPYRFTLPEALITAHGALAQRRGWLLRLEAETGALGWGEATLLPPETPDPEALAAAIAALPVSLDRVALESLLPSLPLPLQGALGLALAELDGLGSEGQGGWWPPPASAVLLPAGAAMLSALERVLASAEARAPQAPSRLPLTVKWKVAAADPDLEWSLLSALLDRLPAAARLRLDANGGWDRITAWRWADRLLDDERLEWLEQPLAPADGPGLRQLAVRLPVALDESRRCDPGLARHWPGWLVRRPLLEGDPRPLLQALTAGQRRWMVSTAFETGIGWRLVGHLAALQQWGPTPCAPGLAPGWRPPGGLFQADPAAVWEAALWS